MIAWRAERSSQWPSAYLVPGLDGLTLRPWLGPSFSQVLPSTFSSSQFGVAGLGAVCAIRTS